MGFCLEPANFKDFTVGNNEIDFGSTGEDSQNKAWMYGSRSMLPTRDADGFFIQQQENEQCCMWTKWKMTLSLIWIWKMSMFKDNHPNSFRSIHAETAACKLHCILESTSDWKERCTHLFQRKLFGSCRADVLNGIDVWFKVVAEHVSERRVLLWTDVITDLKNNNNRSLHSVGITDRVQRSSSSID